MTSFTAKVHYGDEVKITYADLKDNYELYKLIMHSWCETTLQSQTSSHHVP